MPSHWHMTNFNVSAEMHAVAVFELRLLPIGLPISPDDYEKLVEAVGTF